MKRFKFRLQKVLDYRHTEKRDRERELAQRNHELHTAEERLEEIIRASEKAVLPTEGIMTMGEVLLHGSYHQRLRESLEEQRLLIIEAARAVDCAREAYIEKASETGALENVKANRLEEFKQERLRQERKAIDELVVQRHRLRKDGGSGNE